MRTKEDLQTITAKQKDPSFNIASVDKALLFGVLIRMLYDDSCLDKGRIYLRTKRGGIKHATRQFLVNGRYACAPLLLMCHPVHHLPIDLTIIKRS